MATKAADAPALVSQGENCGFHPSQAGPLEHQCSRAANTVIKRGPLFISSRGIGWTSWKKRWFILTRTSLVFFRSDPTSTPQRNGEVNLTLGGIDLNNSGSVEVKPDKKLLTVLFADGRDGRAFTLKAETLEDLYEWKTALESAFAQAPSATLAVGQNGILKTEQADAVNGSTDQQKDRLPVKSMVIGRPILLALEDIDGSPSFMEKALRFIEDHGVKVEGILRQAADVEEVERRVHEYEQGRTEFSPAEDAHVIADCVKHVLRELPSPPVPASCCNALLEALRTDHNNRVNAMRIAILETFPEPNRRLLQRILRMMQTVASHKSDNRMSTSAVAACMSPLLLRPLLAGDCESEKQPLDVAGDGSFQLLQAAAAANHAQAIIIILLDEYDYIFGEGSGSPESFSDSEESGTETEATEDDLYDDDDDDHEYGTEDHDGETDDEYGHSVCGTCTDNGDDEDGESYDDKQSDRSSFVSKSPERDEHHELVRSTASSRSSTPRHDTRQGSETMVTNETTRDLSGETSQVNDSAAQCRKICPKSASTLYESGDRRRRCGWACSPAQKNISMESIDFSLAEEEEIRKLEAVKNELQNRITQEADGNALLQSNIEKLKKALHERRLALERDVARLQEQLQKERDLRASLEAGLGMVQGPASSHIDEKTKAELQEISIAEEDLNNLKQRFDDLETQLNQQREQNYYHQHDRNFLRQEGPAREAISINKQKDNESKAAVTSHHERSIRSKEQPSQNSDGGDCDNESRYDISSLSNNNQNLLSAAALDGRGVGVPNNSFSGEAPTPKPTHSSHSKKNSKGEEGGKKGSSPKSHNLFNLNFDRGRKPDIQQTQQADSVKSESQSSKNVDKGQQSEEQVSTSESQSSRSSDKALIRRPVF